MRHPIPGAALDDRLGFIGTSGSGKTYNAGTAVEILLAVRHARVVIIDPLGVWWGLRLLADGKKPSGFDVVIFGGDHADLPLNDQAGALIGETAAGMAESCIIDLSGLRGKSAERRFMTAFLDTIYQRANKEPFHLVVDEADLFAPQKPQSGAETLLGHMEDIVRRGRVKGFIPWLISQRPAVINKNVLSQVDGLLAFKLTATQDRDALDAWIEGQADKAEGKRIKDSLPTLQIGQGVVWIPGRGILTTASFPPKITFDSSRTPKRGEKLKSRKLKPLDVGKLKEQLATFVEQQKANDPAALKKKIAELEAAAKKAAPAPAKPVIDKDALEAAEQRGFEQARKKLARSTERELQKRLGELLKTLREETLKFADVLKLAIDTAREREATAGEITFTPSTPAPAAKPAAVARPAPPPRAPRPQPEGDGSLTGALLETLQVLAWWKALGHEQPSRKQFAGMLGIPPAGSTMRGRLAALLKQGLIVYPSDGRVSLTPAGEASAPPPDMHASLIETLRNSLTPAERETFDAIPAYPGDTSRDELGTILGIPPAGSTMRGRLSTLKNREIIFYPTAGTVSRQDWVVG